jgi:glycosyltransferase involved in cell wall biosynthesis
MNKKLLSLYATPVAGNGLDRVILNLAKTISELGFRVDVVVPEVSIQHQKFLGTLPPEVRTIDLGIPFSKTIFLPKILKLKQYLEKEKPSILLANGDYVGVSNLAKFGARSQVKIIHAVHISISHYFNNFDYDSRFKARIRLLLLKQFYSRSDGLIAVSNGVASDLSHVSGISLEKIQVIYNPVVTSDILLKAQEPVAHPWFAPGELPIILGAGRLMYQKDFSTLIRAFAKVRQQRPCRLVIIGKETSHKAELDALIHELDVAEDVWLGGFADNPYAYMAKASVFVMSSRYEGFGNVLVEAMATGTPVVSTDCESGPAEILEYGKYGHLVPVGDENKLSEAILATLDNPLDPHVLQQRSQDFTAETIAQEYLTYFKMLVN